MPEIDNLICPLCDYKSDTENELIGHLVADHGFPPKIALSMASEALKQERKGG